MRFTKILAALLASTIATSTFAATQGGVGDTSTGTATISSSVNGKVRITNLNDIDLGTWDGVNAQTGSDDVCVWSTTRSYEIVATGTGNNGAFAIQGSDDNELAYSVTWSNDGIAQGAALTAGQTLSNQDTNARSAVCAANGDKLAELTVTIASAELQANAIADNYSGVLTLTVSPL